MATVLRRTDPLMSVIVTAHNDLKAQIGAGSHYHLDAYETPVSAANGDGTLATALTLVNQIMAIYLAHIGDTLAHKVAQTPPALVKATDLASAITLANAMKADFNTNDGSTTYHYTADTGDEATTNASDQGTLDTLLNAFKVTLNAHMANAPSAKSLRLVDA